MSPLTKRPKTKILVDGGDPQETQKIKELLGFVDGQTTNPSLIAKNPHIMQLIASGHKLTEQEELDEYKKITLEYGLTEIDATQSIGEQQRIVREYIDQTLADYTPPVEAEDAA